MCSLLEVSLFFEGPLREVINVIFFLVVDCGVPDRPSTGFGGLAVEFENTTYNETAFYNCTDEDLTLVGDDERICQANGMWSGDPPFCESKISKSHKAKLFESCQQGESILL